MRNLTDTDSREGLWEAVAGEWWTAAGHGGYVLQLKAQSSMGE